MKRGAGKYSELFTKFLTRLLVVRQDKRQRHTHTQIPEVGFECVANMHVCIHVCFLYLYPVGIKEIDF